MEKVVVTRNKQNNNVFDVKMTITEGKLIALMFALEQRCKESPVATDLYDMLMNEEEVVKVYKPQS